MSNKGVKTVVTGKGGVGKSTITSLLSMALANSGYSVLALDADPQMNLPYTLGVSYEKIKEIVPLNSADDYIEEKTGARPGKSWGAFFKLNPDVGDVIERFGLKVNSNLGVLVMGTVKKAAAGCLCPENALLDKVVRHISLMKDQYIVMDTQAGVEHFGRAIADGFDKCFIVADPSFNALDVAKHTQKLAKDLGIKEIYLVLNKFKEKHIQKLEETSQFLGLDLERDFDYIIKIPHLEEIENEELDIAKLMQLKEIQEPLAELKDKVTNDLVESREGSI
ncbi:MAG: AAA family ATPase [Flexistipes sinusarabici]|uniref:AAA family ATPase n=1 Tax=Flexistipes sinusarabici TaxID=2352 RepID=A0A5D0MLA0_FLESI|nr:P-loop NTPase [Flexistipes sinusarabici]TYB32705.1 MAG: AAA family ATPase [Flexistipes sinusarabici]